MMKKLCLIIFTALLTGCTALKAPRAENTHTYLLDALPAASAGKSDLVLAISMPLSRPGFDTPQMAYQKLPLELEYYATHRWADTPVRMLRPLLVQSLEPAFRAVMQTPGSADLRLDTELIRLQQNFTGQPSQIRLTIRAQLIDMRRKQVIATTLFDEYEDAGNDAYSGVQAANRALERTLSQLAHFCLNASAGHGVR